MFPLTVHKGSLFLTSSLALTSYLFEWSQSNRWGFPGDKVIKNPPDNAEDSRDAGSVPGSGRSSGVGNGNLLQHSCLKNSRDRGTWQATVHGITKS